MDRLRDYSLLHLMTVSSRSAVFADRVREHKQRRSTTGDVSDVCRSRAGLDADRIGGRSSNQHLRPVSVATDPLGRPLVLPYVSGSDAPSPERPGERHSRRAECLKPQLEPDFSSTIVLSSMRKPDGES